MRLIYENLLNEVFQMFLCDVCTIIIMTMKQRTANMTGVGREDAINYREKKIKTERMRDRDRERESQRRNNIFGFCSLLAFTQRWQEMSKWQTVDLVSEMPVMYSVSCRILRHAPEL